MVNVFVEGLTDVIVIRRVLDFAGVTPQIVRVAGGKSKLLPDIPKYNQAARFSPWLVIVDLDQDAGCAPQYKQRLLEKPSEHMALRIAVRAIESWLLADREHLAKFLNVPIAPLPDDPEYEINPKRKLFDIASHSRKKALREDIVPRPGSGASSGPGYPARIREFITHDRYPWRPDVAAQHAPSLNKCLLSLNQWRKDS